MVRAVCALAATVVAIVLGATTACAATASFSHALLDTVLRRHVRAERVDYGGLSRDHAALDRYLRAAAEARPDRWPRAEQMAFWINVYNARVLDGVIRRPGLRSVMDVRDSAGAPVFFHERRRSSGRSLSLDEIENQILRGHFGDPRVHFVLNCASASCPALPERALTAATLDAELDRATARFLGDPRRNRVDPARGLELSAIFQWYAADFDSCAGGVRGFIAHHQPGGAPLAPELRLRYLGYDWSLNGTW